MNCIEFEAAAERGIETRAPLPRAAVEHAAACSDCRSVWQIQRQLETAIAVWRSVVPAADFVDAVLAELAMPSLTEAPLVPRVTEDRRKTRSGGLAVASVAACLIVAVVFTTQQAGRKPLDLARLSRARSTEQAAEHAPMDVSQTLSAVVSDLRSEYRQMASETTSVARNLVNAIPHGMTVVARPDPEAIEPLPTSSDVARIWLPIGSRVEIALDFLWQAVPSEVPSG